jgi:hypothetical protein
VKPPLPPPLLLPAVLLLVGATPFLPLVAKACERSGKDRLHRVGAFLAPIALYVAFNVSLLAMGGIAFMRFRLDGPLGIVSAWGFVLLQPVGVVVVRRITREGA